MARDGKALNFGGGWEVKAEETTGQQSIAQVMDNERMSASLDWLKETELYAVVLP